DQKCQRHRGRRAAPYGAGGDGDGIVSMRRVVITGVGLVTPIGAGRESFWRNLTDGVNGIGPVESFDTSAFPVHIGAEVKDFHPQSELGRGSQLAVAAARMAL